MFYKQNQRKMNYYTGRKRSRYNCYNSYSNYPNKRGNCITCGKTLFGKNYWKVQCLACWGNDNLPVHSDFQENNYVSSESGFFNDNKRGNCLDCGKPLFGLNKWKIRCLNCWKMDQSFD